MNQEKDPTLLVNILCDDDDQPKQIGGFREGAGRKKVEGGVRRMWTVPPDVDAVVQERGTKWLWEAARFKLAFERMQENQ